MKDNHFESLYPDATRFVEVKKLAEFVKRGASTQLISIPGAGRSALLGLLAHNKNLRIKHFGKEEVKMHFVVVNFTEIRNRPLIDVVKFIFLALVDSLRERGMDSHFLRVNKLLKEYLGFNDELALFQAFKEAVDYLGLENDIKLVFLFDKFEEYIPSATKQFFTNLRVLRARAKYNFSVIFSLNRPLEDLLETDIMSDYHEFVAGNYVYLSLYDEQMANFRISYIEKVTAKKIKPEILSKLIKETGGVGKLLKLSAEAVLSSVEVDKLDLGDFLYSQKTIQEALSEICRSLLPPEQTALIKDDYSNPDIVSYLESIGILQNNNIQIPLFKKHIASHIVDFKGESRKITYQPQNNTILKEDIILSDQLTGSEFKLLSFLLNSQERIVTRDEMIAATWSDVKSTAGITDQAVDQLIFRLRRKIEDNPNTPTHLLTVKGRGFRFIQ